MSPGPSLLDEGGPLRFMASMVRSLALFLPCVLALACGGGDDRRTLPDESGDLDVGGSRTGHLEGTRPAGPDLDRTYWSFVEATCTEGEPHHIDESFRRTVDISADDQGLLMTYDQSIGDDCRETIVQRARPGAETDQEWQMREDARVHVGECPTDPEADRPGDVRRRGEFLEIYVQRSNWCNGLEVKMVYSPAQRAEPTGEELIRRYAAHFQRQDATRITRLFAAEGSLVDPYTRTPTDQAMRYDGQAAIYGWFQETFANTPWLAMRVMEIEEGPAPGAFTMNWQYMDPRLDNPFAARNLFTIAGGAIFETSIEITDTEVEVEEPPAAAAEATPPPADPEAAEPEAPADPEAGAE